MILRYKASIPGNKLFYREYEFRGEMKLFALNTFLQNELGFAPDQMIVFESIDATDKVIHEYGLFDISGLSSETIDTVTIEKTLARKERLLRYVYNLTHHRFILLEYLSEEEETPRASYPRVIQEKGPNPDQFSDKYDDFPEYLQEMEEISPGEGGEEED